MGYARSERRTKLSADRLSLNRWALAGRWTVDEESAVLGAAAGSTAFRFEGRDLNLVMTADAADAARPRTFEITFLDPGVRAYVFRFG